MALTIAQSVNRLVRGSLECGDASPLFVAVAAGFQGRGKSGVIPPHSKGECSPCERSRIGEKLVPFGVVPK